MKRMPAVADRFYPGEPFQLQAALNRLVPAVKQEQKQKAVALVLPHAGYMYSGATAGETVSRVRIPETVVILGPNHHGRGAPLAIGMDDWQMPLGGVPIARQLAETIRCYAAEIVADQDAHLLEHSLEVQIPFLQQEQPLLQIVPIVFSSLSYIRCQAVAHGLAMAIREYAQPVLIVASTDMSHYESRGEATKKDTQAIEQILALDPHGLYTTVVEQQITMCGVIPATIALLAALELGATTAGLVRYTDSGEASGDTRQVVGYAGLIIS